MMLLTVRDGRNVCRIGWTSVVWRDLTEARILAKRDASRLCLKSAARRAIRSVHESVNVQLTRVAPSSADHSHAAEPYSSDEGKCNLPCALVVSIVRLESKVERHCVLRVEKYAAIRTRQEEPAFTGRCLLEDSHR